MRHLSTALLNALNASVFRFEGVYSTVIGVRGNI